MNKDEIMALADAYANQMLHSHYHPMMEARAALEAALTEKQDNTAALNVQYHEASMRKFFGTDKQEPRLCPKCSVDWLTGNPVAEQEPVALETIYETIINWDEGGGKRSRRELARRIAALTHTAPEAKQEPKTLHEQQVEEWKQFMEAKAHWVKEIKE